MFLPEQRPKTFLLLECENVQLLNVVYYEDLKYTYFL